MRGLILDFAGVMTTPIGQSSRAWCAREGLPADTWRSTLEDDPAGRALYVELELGRMSQEEWNRGTAAIMGVEPDNLMGRAHAEVRAVPAMAELARAARDAGIVVALLSNSYGLAPYNPYVETGVWDLFDVRVISGDEGIAKPEPAIYQRALDRMGLAGPECVFVDDHRRNLPPAEALGITTVHADGPETASKVARLLELVTPRSTDLSPDEAITGAWLTTD
ncbi:MULTISPECIES: HAD family hydrolase [unclassified Kitasatospora]|uniref:HAD family hydrolase n=1 Tax=unclassified Kitasatospora TaxID=2633591 RepID=UPI0038231AE0